MNQQRQKFSIYNHRLVMSDNRLITRKFIVLKYSDGTLKFTNFHQYVKSPNRSTRDVTEDGNSRFDFVIKLLNYAFFERKIPCLDALTIDIVKDFLNAYGLGILPGDKQGRTKSTVESCIAAILDFLELYIADRKGMSAITKDQLFKYVTKRNRRGQTIKKKVPAFDIVYSARKKSIYRDIPDHAFHMLFNHIAVYYPDLLAVVSLSAFGGLRPSEACNVRREDSPLGPGIIFNIVNGEINKVQIDLRKELCLRSDLKPTGKIKKERIQTIPLMFTDVFVESYNKYMDYMEGRKFERDYGALTVNLQGKAFTYDSYYQLFRKIIRDEMIPKFLASDDMETAAFGNLLLENNLAPHVFRHWYTVQLVLSGVETVAELMAARGDSSPESCEPYLKDKGALAKRYKRVNDEMFNYMSWKAEKQMNLK